MSQTFLDRGLSSSTLSALEKKGFTTPSPIQEACIPLLLSGKKDIIGQAQTGTGKTAAFAIPVIEQVDAHKKHPQALILTPTRELAIQVSEEIFSLKGDKRLTLALVYGGSSMTQQMKTLRSGAQIVVGTPGRVIDLINRRVLHVDQLDFLILDEADEMLNMGFLDDIKTILQSTNDDKRMLLFSATMPRAIMDIAKTHMRDYDIVKVAAQELTTTNTEQVYFEVRESDKIEAVSRIIDSEENFYGIIFCRTKSECDTLSQHLQQRGYLTDALHGDLSQKQREQVFARFKKQKTSILVATDIAARGLDVSNLSHVINYHIPQSAESYTHRIGRTGRAGNRGVAITFVTPAEYRKLMYIQKVTQSTIAKKSLPSVDEIITNRTQNIIKRIAEAQGHNDSKYVGMANDLLTNEVPENLVAKLLQLAFGAQLDEKNYRDISASQSRVDMTGTTRLFIARGRKDGMDARGIVDMLKAEADVSDKDIDNVVVMQDFSFVTCPFAEAEMIIRAFQQKEGRSIISIAKDKSDGGDRRDRGRGGSGGFRRRPSNDRGGFGANRRPRRSF